MDSFFLGAKIAQGVIGFVLCLGGFFVCVIMLGALIAKILEQLD